MWRGERGSARLGALLATCVPAEGARERMALALARARWSRAVGASVASHTVILALARGWLTVGVPNKAVEERLERQRTVLFAALCQLPDGTRVRGLSFEIVPIARIRALLADPAARRQPPAATLPSLDLLSPAQRAALATLEGDESLYRAFETWMTRNAARAHDRERNKGGGTR